MLQIFALPEWKWPDGRNAQRVWLYLLRCADGTLYTGIALDPDRRLLVHARGRGSKYVATRLPACIVYREGPLARGDALRREIEVKRLSRSQKEALIVLTGP